MKGMGGKCRVPSELMVLENQEFEGLTESLRADFLSDATAKNSGEHTR